MIKLQDFAKECGVTDRAIQKHLQKHEKELEGHYERRGKNGTWLDETAQAFIRSLMIQQPVVVGDESLYRDYEALRKENEELLKENKEVWKALSMAREQLLDVKDAQLQLDAAKKEKELLEGFIRDAKKEIDTLTREKAQEVAQACSEASEAIRREQVALEQKSSVEAENEALREALKEAEGKLDEVKKLPWYKRLRWKG